MNTIKFKDYEAVISYDPDINMFRGEFVGLNGGADFYATNVDDLHREGEISLQVFLDACKERGIEPRKHFSGKFNLRIPPTLHESLAVQAAAHGKSINSWILDLLTKRSEQDCY
jgi:predicted HicB family RNase H-like nuclease